MFNVILIGKILDEIHFKKIISGIVSLKKEKKINQIILSIWKNQKLSNKIIFFLKKNNVDIIRNKDKKFEYSLKYQTYLLKNGLKKIKDKRILIIKLRTDINFKFGQIFKLSKLNFKTQNKKKILSRKIWVPYFEITKPFYIADEIIVTNYINFKKITSFKKYYGDIFFDTGQTHINWYLGLFIKKFNILDTYVKHFGKSYHFKSTRFFHLTKLINNQEYLKILIQYYKILDKYFIIGSNLKKNFSLNRKTIGFFNQNFIINFKDKTINDIFSINNSHVKYSGHIFSRNNNDIKKLIKLVAKQIFQFHSKKSFRVKKKSLIVRALLEFKHIYNFLIFKINF
tara:strand:+ start:421 stop:1443 length:1023 start_codon:yes stop_codon:yes gene_type:complete